MTSPSVQPVTSGGREAVHTPWQRLGYVIFDATGGAVVELPADKRDRDVLDQIVQCVNSHDELHAIAAALLAEDADIEAIVERARAAIASWAR